MAACCGASLVGSAICVLLCRWQIRRMRQPNRWRKMRARFERFDIGFFWLCGSAFLVFLGVLLLPIFLALGLKQIGFPAAVGSFALSGIFCGMATWEAFNHPPVYPLDKFLLRPVFSTLTASVFMITGYLVWMVLI